jgi:integrase
MAKLTKTRIDSLKPGEIVYDGEVRGFCARCLPSGRVSYGYRYRAAGKSRWLGLGMHGELTVEQARTLAKRKAGEVAHDRDPQAERKQARAEAAKARTAEKNSVDFVLDEFVKRHASNLRSAEQVTRAFDAYVRPRIGSKSVYDIKRRDIVEMLDAVEDEAGPVMADRTLAHVRKAFNWWATRDDEFANPVIRGMARTKPKERARSRVLTDDELRDVWKALDSATVPYCYRRYIRFLLLTATRRNEAAHMTADEVAGDVWTVPAERYKTKHDHAVPLTARSMALIGEGKGFVFSTTDGAKPFSGFSKAKAALDAAIAELRKEEGRGKMPEWRLHDLRRTARSLMSRAGVSSDHAERVLGHVIAGVAGVYDRHEYLAEKRIALEKLAGLVDLILHPVDNVIAMERAR